MSSVGRTRVSGAPRGIRGLQKRGGVGNPRDWTGAPSFTTLPRGRALPPRGLHEGGMVLSPQIWLWGGCLAASWGCWWEEEKGFFLCCYGRQRMRLEISQVSSSQPT